MKIGRPLNFNKKTNRKLLRYENLLSVYKALIAKVEQSSTESRKQKHRKAGKLLPLERINQLKDIGTPFLELSKLSGVLAEDGTPPGACIKTGICFVNGQACVVIANDSTVKAGTYFPLTIKKHLRAQEIAEQNRLPCIYLVDSGGAFLPLQHKVFPDKNHFGRFFYNQARMNAKSIPQLAVVFGMCTAGGAYIPAMCQESVIVKKSGTVFLGGPPLVKAATGESVTALELGGGDVHTRISGVVEHLANDEISAIEKIREIVGDIYNDHNSIGNYSPKNEFISSANKPKFKAEEISSFIPEDSAGEVEMIEVIARIVDESDFNFFKPRYGDSLITGTAKIFGRKVGIVASNGVLFTESANKGAQFIRLMEQRRIPLLFLQDIAGFMVGTQAEHSGIAKAGAIMIDAISNVSVPKITIIAGKSYGAGNYAMCGRGFSPNFLFTWLSAETAVMGAEQATKVLKTIFSSKKKNINEDEFLKIAENFKSKSEVWFSTSELWDDGIIEPKDTRNIVGLALECCTHRLPEISSSFSDALRF